MFAATILEVIGTRGGTFDEGDPARRAEGKFPTAPDADATVEENLDWNASTFKARRQLATRLSDPVERQRLFRVGAREISTELRAVLDLCLEVA